jgi:hypothetical protein
MNSARLGGPALFSQGLLTEKKVLFMKSWHLTPAGEAV